MKSTAVPTKLTTTSTDEHECNAEDVRELEKGKDTPRQNVTSHLQAQAQQQSMQQQQHQPLQTIDDNIEFDDDDDDDDDELSVTTIGSEIVRRVVTRKRFWSAVAVCSFAIGFGCLITAMNLSAADSQRGRPRRMYTTKR